MASSSPKAAEHRKINVDIAASPLTSIISPHHHHHPSDKHATIGTKTKQSNHTNRPSTEAASGDHRPKAGEPFGNYVLRVLQPAPGVFTELVAASACLYLFRSDPHELKSLTHYWASLKRHELEGIKSNMLTRGLSSTSLFSANDEEAVTPRTSPSELPNGSKNGREKHEEGRAEDDKERPNEVMMALSQVGHSLQGEDNLSQLDEHQCHQGSIGTKECIRLAASSGPNKDASPQEVVTPCLLSPPAGEPPFTPIAGDDTSTNVTTNTLNYPKEPLVASMDLRAVINIGKTAGIEECEKEQQEKGGSPCATKRKCSEGPLELKHTNTLNHEVEAAPGGDKNSTPREQQEGNTSTVCDPFLLASGSTVFSPNGSQQMPSPCCLEAKLTQDQLVEHFLSTLQCCIVSYFSYNWDSVEGTMQVNQEHKTYVERELIPRLERRRRFSMSHGDITPAEASTPSYKDLVPPASGAGSPASLAYSRATSEVGSATSSQQVFPSHLANEHAASATSTAHTITTSSGRFPSQPTTRNVTRTFSNERGSPQRTRTSYSITSQVDTEDEADATPALTPQASEMAESIPTNGRHRYPPQILEATTVHASTVSPFAIPSDIRWVTSQNISKVRAEAACTGLLLVFHAAFSMPSCQTLVDIDNLFKKELSSEEAARAAWEEVKNRRKLPVCNPSNTFTPLSLTTTPADSGADKDYNSKMPIYTPIDSLGSTTSTTASTVFPSHSFGYCVPEPESFVPPKWGVVNAPTEPQLYAAYKVSWFPTIVFIPPVDVHSSPPMTATSPSSVTTDATMPGPSSALLHPTTAAPSLSESPDSHHHATHSSPLLFEVPKGQAPAQGGAQNWTASRARELARAMKASTDHHITYPEKGIRQPRYLLEWLLRRGEGGAYEKRVKSTITTFAVLAKQLQFASQRRQISGALALKKRQIHDPNPPTHSKEEPPVFVIIGGGMAAGKTTAATALSQSQWWHKYGNNAVIIDADEFKYNDPLFKSNSPDLHKKSLEASEELLIDALNEGRDIVLDGTMSWLPYVQQTFEMVRDAHQYCYKRSDIGYAPKEGLEEYWERVCERPTPLAAPYLIKFVGITVDPSKAVQRGILRRINTGRSVPLKAQLRSFRLFSQGFKQYCDWADLAVLYNNNVRVDLSAGQLPNVIAEKAKGGALVIKDVAAFKDFLRHSHINQNATSEDDLWLENRVRPDWELEKLGRADCNIGGTKPTLEVEERFRYSTKREGEEEPPNQSSTSDDKPQKASKGMTSNKDDVDANEGGASAAASVTSPMSIISPQDTMPPVSGEHHEAEDGMPATISVSNDCHHEEEGVAAPANSFASTAEPRSTTAPRAQGTSTSSHISLKPTSMGICNSVASSPMLDIRQQTAAFADQ